MISKKNIMLIGSIFMVSILALSIFLPIFLNSTIKTSSTNDVNINEEKFFSDTNIDKNAKYIEIFNENNKDLILKNFTNYDNVYDYVDLTFNNVLIKNNIIKVVKEAITQKQSYLKIDKLKLQIRYKLISDYNMYVDIRWKETNKTAFYYFKKKINLEIF